MSSGLIHAYARLLPCVCFLLLFPPARLSAEDPYPDLWARAESLKLWNRPEWFTLGHYHRTLWLRIESRIDDPRFFLAPDGKTDRRAELNATLRAFTRPDPAETSGERTLACRFPARRRWLIEALDLTDEDFIVPDCPAYSRVLEQLQLTQATLAYPSAYMNSPASMFGHLLLVIDREDKSRLLSKAVNYAALVEDTFGPLFAIKGIFGLYDGVFAILPYYEKVEEYSAVNRRDIWEYPLNLDADAFDRLMRHVWELQELRSRYFFFKENCAFNLLYAIEAGRPDLQLTRRFRLSAIPVNLLRELNETGVLGEPVYRPSKTSQMAHLANFLEPGAQQKALQMAQGLTPPSEADCPVTLSLAVEITQHHYTEKQIPPEVYRERVLPLLRERSRRGKVDLPPIPTPAPPETAHAPRRIFLYGGTGLNRENLAGIRLRAAYHDELDMPTGFTPGSAITFLEADLRASEDLNRLSLHELTLVEIASLTPHTLWASPLSWSVSFRIEEAPFHPEHHRGDITFATGRTWAPANRTLLYTLFASTLLRDTDLDDNFAWEPGLQAGIRFTGDRLRTGIHTSTRHGVLGSDILRHRTDAELRYALSPALSVGTRFTYRYEDSHSLQERLLTLSYTF
jgi:hypothetical protein